MTTPAPRPAAPQHAAFLVLLPVVERHARVVFRHLPPADREEAAAEAVAGAFESFVRLVARGQNPLLFPSWMATFAALHVKIGRKVGNRLNTKDVLSPAAQQQRGFRVESLDELGARHEAAWHEAVADDTQTPVPDQAAFRLDFPDWLRTLSRRDRRIVHLLSLGHSTQWTARRFQVSEARISQLRRRYLRDWRRFHGEPSPEADATAARA